MSRLQEVADKQVAMNTILNLTGVFEGLASMRIAGVKNQVLESQQFFSEIWNIYKQIRVDSLFRFGRTGQDDVIKKKLYIIITAGSEVSSAGWPSPSRHSLSKPRAS